MRNLLLVMVVVVGCSKKEGDAPATGSAATPTAPAPGSATATPPPAPPAPPPPTPEPVKMTAEELKPTCEKIFTAEVIAKSHGATKVEQQGGAPGKPLAICQMSKGEEVVGSVTIACNPDLDTALIERERSAMTKAKDIPAGIGRGGYRISNAFFFNDDETPCRLNANFMSPPEDEAALATALRAITTAVNPTTLK